MAHLFTFWKEETGGDPESVALLDANYAYVEQLRARYEAEDIYNSCLIRCETCLRVATWLNLRGCRCAPSTRFRCFLTSRLPCRTYSAQRPSTLTG